MLVCLNKFPRLLLIATLLSAFLPVQANVNTVTPMPPTVTLSNGQNVLNVVWQVARTQGNIGPNPLSVATFSSNAELRIGGSSVAVLGGMIEQVGNVLNSGETETLMFTESLSLSALLFARVANATVGSVTIQRTFNDGQSTMLGTMALLGPNIPPPATPPTTTPPSVQPPSSISTVVSMPQNVSASVKNPSVFNITWQVSRTVMVSGPTPITMASNNAELRIAGNTIATLAGQISQIGVVPGAGQTEILRFTETLSLSPMLARRIANASAGTVSIRRIFTDGQSISVGTVMVFSSLGGDGVLGVRRIELSFDNNTRSDVVRIGGSVRAVADVSFVNSGVLQGEWRVVDARGGARRILEVVYRSLVSTGEGRVRIVSPPIPTDLTGLHLVSFSVHDSTAEIDVPILRYYVMQDGGSVGALPAVNILTHAPAENASLFTDTVFSWEPVKNSIAYQVEVFDSTSNKPVTGKLVTANNTKLSLLLLSLDNLQRDKPYYWRVKAFSKDGRVLGVSPPLRAYIH